MNYVNYGAQIKANLSRLVKDFLKNIKYLKYKQKLTGELSDKVQMVLNL